MSFFRQLFSSLSAAHRVPDRVVGIDIGSSSVKVVELEDREGVVTLSTYGELQLGPYGEKEVGQAVTLDSRQEQQALVDVLRESAVKAEEAVFAMPLSSSFVTTIDFKAAKNEELESRVRVEARKYIPAAISEVTLDWAEIEGPEDVDERNRSILLAAIQNDALARFRTLMAFVKLPEPPTEIECFSAVRSLYDQAEDEIAVVDLGAVSAKLYIAKNGLVQRMHRVRAGGAISTKRIASVLEVDIDEAELRKRNLSSVEDVSGDIKRAHHATYDRAFHEFRQVIEEYEQLFGTKLDAVYLTGGAALFPGISNLLAEELQREVALADPFSKVAYPAFMEDMLREIGPSFTVALGAALRGYE